MFYIYFLLGEDGKRMGRGWGEEDDENAWGDGDGHRGVHVPLCMRGIQRKKGGERKRRKETGEGRALHNMIIFS